MNVLRSAALDAWRLLRARPLANFTVALVLACGLIGVSTVAAISETVSGVAPQAISSEGLYSLGAGQGGGDSLTLPGEDALGLRREVPGLAAAALLRSNDFNIAGGDAHDTAAAERVSGILIDGDLFATLGWSMALGRGFAADDFAANAEPVVVIGNRLWRSRFAADPAVIGTSIRLDGVPMTVVGVLPPGRAYPFQQQVYRAVHLPLLSAHWPRPWQMLVRLDDPSRSGPIAAELAARQRDREQKLGDSAKENPLRMALVFDDTGSSDAGTQMLVLLMGVVVGLVMLLAASNASSLLLVQWLERGRELATRHALGATAQRALGGLLVQGLLLASGGWLLAVLVSQSALDALNQYLWTSENGQPLYIVMKISPKVVVVSGLVALLSVLLLIWPTWRQLRRGDLALELRSGSRTAGGVLSRIGRLLFGLQALLAVVTVLATLQAVDGARMQLQRGLGMATGAIIAAQFNSGDPVAKGAFAQRLREALAAEPGVAAVTVSGSLPVALTSSRTLANGEARSRAEFAPVDLGYRDVYDIKLMRGRWFQTEDIDQHRPVAVVDPALAADLFGSADPIGRRFSAQEAGGPVEYTVIGLSVPLRLVGNGGEDSATVLVPVAKQPAHELAVSVRVNGDMDGLILRLAALARAINPDIALTDLGRFEDIRWRAASWTRMMLSLFAPLGGIALLLASVGLAALLGSLVNQRVREIGVRRALGASAGRIVHALAAGLAVWAMAGMTAGMLLALLLVRPLSQTLYGDSRLSPLTVMVTVLVMAIALIIAAAVPLRRALRIAPTEALRCE